MSGVVVDRGGARVNYIFNKIWHYLARPQPCHTPTLSSPHTKAQTGQDKTSSQASSFHVDTLVSSSSPSFASHPSSSSFPTIHNLSSLLPGYGHCAHLRTPHILYHATHHHRKTHDRPCTSDTPLMKKPFHNMMTCYHSQKVHMQSSFSSRTMVGVLGGETPCRRWF